MKGDLVTGSLTPGSIPYIKFMIFTYSQADIPFRCKFHYINILPMSHTFHSFQLRTFALILLPRKFLMVKPSA